MSLRNSSNQSGSHFYCEHGSNNSREGQSVTQGPFTGPHSRYWQGHHLRMTGYHQRPSHLPRTQTCRPSPFFCRISPSRHHQTWCLHCLEERLGLPCLQPLHSSAVLVEADEKRHSCELRWFCVCDINVTSSSSQ